MPTVSGEILLVRRDGADILFLNNLRFDRDAALKRRVPLVDTDLPAAQVLRGAASQGDLVAGRDYRGVPVFGVARAVRGTDWLLVAKEDRAEVVRDVAGDAAWIAMVGLLALCGIGSAAYVRRQRRQLADASAVHRSQAEQLRALSLLKALIDSSTDAIYAKDLNGRYLLCNDAAAAFCGRSPQSMRGRDDDELFPPKVAAMIRARDREVIDSGGIHTFEELMDAPRSRAC